MFNRDMSWGQHTIEVAHLGHHTMLRVITGSTGYCRVGGYVCHDPLFNELDLPKINLKVHGDHMTSSLDGINVA